jgi:hypothetical protein
MDTRRGEAVAFEPEPTFGDLIRFLWRRRVRLFVLFLIFAGTFAVLLIGWRFLVAQPVVEGTLHLSFRGMERHEYPSGKKFSVEDLRSPDVLSHARSSSGIPPSVDLKTLYVGVEITPVIPPEVQSRWRKQDRDGARREEFFPNEFRLRVNPKGLSSDQKLQFLAALLEAFRASAKFEQEAALRRVSDLSNLSPAELVKNYDTWDIPTLLREREWAFRQQIEALTKESHEFRDPRFGISFREIGNQLETWKRTRLEALTASIYQGRLVKDRESMVRRLQERLESLDTQAKMLNGEAEQSTKLIESMDRTKPFLAGSLTNRDGAPLIDTTALEKLVKSDYIGPVVKRITELHKQAKEVEAERSRVEREAALLAKPGPMSSKPPAGFDDLVALVTKDLSRTITDYNRVLDEYLGATVTSLITLKEGPRVTRGGPSMAILAAALLCVSVILPFVVVLIEKAAREG